MAEVARLGTNRGDLRCLVGADLRCLRASRQISQDEMAWAVEVTQGTISNYESGRSDIPLTALIAICDVLEVSPVEVIRRALRMSPAFRDSRGLPHRH